MIRWRGRPALKARLCEGTDGRTETVRHSRRTKQVGRPIGQAGGQAGRPSGRAGRPADRQLPSVHYGNGRDCFASGNTITRIVDGDSGGGLRSPPSRSSERTLPNEVYVSTSFNFKVVPTSNGLLPPTRRQYMWTAAGPLVVAMVLASDHHST